MPTADKLEWGQGNPLFEVMFRTVSEGIYGNGVLGTGDLQVTIGSGDLDVDVNPGSLWYESSTEEKTGTTTLTLSGGDADNDRWDTVYYDVSTSEVGSTEGTPGEYPEPPALSGGEFPLAFIYVPQGSTAIVSGNILNWRSMGTLAENVRYDDDEGTVQSGLDDTRSRLDTAESDIDDAEGRLDTAESDIDTAESDIDGAEGRLDTAESDISTLDNDLSTAESDIDSVESDVSSINDRLEIDGVHVTQRSDLPDPSGMDNPTIGYIDDEDSYVGVYQQ